MPQENQVLRCFSCETFQVHIVKKAKKWECKVCGSKQSFKRHYGKGSGKDCRNHVMKLNERKFAKTCSTVTKEDVLDKPPSESEVTVKRKSVSKWAQYLDEETHSENESTFFKPEKKRKTSEGHNKAKNIYKALDIETGRSTKDLSNNSTRNSKYLKADEVSTKKKTIKNIFESGSDNTDNFLNFI